MFEYSYVLAGCLREDAEVRLIEQLNDEDKQAVYRIIDGMLTKTKFKDFFAKNM